MYMIQIEESAIDKLTDYTGKAMRYMMKAMDCISEMSGHNMDDRRMDETYPIHGRDERYGYRMPMDDDEYQAGRYGRTNERRGMPNRRMPY